MREWLVASGLVEGPDGLLLVQNRRRDGSLDWSPPGGVIEVGDGETVVDGLTREVREETGITVTGWEGPVWRVEAEAPEAQWILRVEVFRATGWQGALRIDDPDGIVVDARFVELDECTAALAAAWAPIHEPMGEWLLERFVDARSYRYRVRGHRPGSPTVRL